MWFMLTIFIKGCCVNVLVNKKTYFLEETPVFVFSFAVIEENYNLLL